MNKDKQKALELLRQKINGEKIISYQEIANETSYSKMQIIRLSKEIEKKDIEDLLVHGLTGKNSNNSAPDQEIEYIKEFKNQYPVISIQQFMDIYHEDVIWNKKKKKDVKKYNLKVRSKSFFQHLFKTQGWKSPIKHKTFKHNEDPHSLRESSPQSGMLVMTDGTPHDWFGNGIKWSLHMTLDDATGKILSGWFTPNESQLGYCYAFIIKNGLPEIIYADRTSILWDSKENQRTQVARMLDELGIELIFANTPQAKGKIERMNETIQNRLLNDIRRYKIKTYSELNKWFNDFYIDYINNKYSYSPADEESAFVPLGKTDLTKIMCIKKERTILNGNMISIDNEYFIPIHPSNENYTFYKGTKVEVWKDVFDGTVRIFKNNKIYNAKKVPGQRIDISKKEKKRIDDQKQLEILLKEKNERLKARTNKVSSS